MKSSLTEGLTDLEAQEAKEEYEKAFRFRKNLTRVLEKDMKTLITNMCDEDHFSKDWSFVQADRVAQLKAFRRFLALLE